MKTEKSQIYTPKFRESSVKLALDSDQSIKQTAEGLGIKLSTLHTWINMLISAQNLPGVWGNSVEKFPPQIV